SKTFTLTIKANDTPPPPPAPVIILDESPVQLYQFGQVALVLQGYLDGSFVFFDANKNGVFDFLDRDGDRLQGPDEPSEAAGVTSPSGRFVLTIPEEFDRDGDGVVSPDEGQLVAVGGVDTASGRPVTAPLIAPGGSFVVSPFTT